LNPCAAAPGHIFNLGHGIMPQAKIECVEALVQTVTTWKA
jgi:uroporphyrinogen decarboxylase